MIDLLLRAAGIEPGKPIPAEVQQVLDEQFDRLADRVTDRLIAALAAPDPAHPNGADTHDVDSSTGTQ